MSFQALGFQFKHRVTESSCSPRSCRDTMQLYELSFNARLSIEVVIEVAIHAKLLNFRQPGVFSQVQSNDKFKQPCWIISRDVSNVEVSNTFEIPVGEGHGVMCREKISCLLFLNLNSH